MDESNTREQKKIKKSKFTIEEDKIIQKCVFEMNKPDWKRIANILKPRTARQCRERWKHYLSTTNYSNNWTNAEDIQLMEEYYNLGPKWKTIQRKFPNHSTINIKNRWALLNRKMITQKRILPLKPIAIPFDLPEEHFQEEIPPVNKTNESEYKENIPFKNSNLDSDSSSEDKEFTKYIHDRNLW